MSSGSALARLFFETEVRPLVDSALPSLGYVGARLGSGSDVLGFDDERSRDHDFGCRLTLLVDEGSSEVVPHIDELLEQQLPNEFEGYPTRFPTTWDGRCRHKVEISTVHAFAKSRLGLDPATELDTVGWLCLTGQSILEVVGGPVFHDTTQSFGPLQQRLAWYPDDVWRYVLAAAWTRLGQELPFVGRTGERADDLGSSVIAARLARDLIHLSFLVNRTWSPYPKWAVTALAGLPNGPELIGSLLAVTGATDWRAREAALCEAIAIVGAEHLEAGFELDAPFVEPFFDRPYLIPGPKTVESIRFGIVDPELRSLPPGIGSVEQWCDNVDVLSHPARRREVERIYRQLMAGTDR